MVSNIDPTKPITGIDQPVQVIRDNFAITKIEIEALQAEKLSLSGGSMTGVLRLAPIDPANLPDPVVNIAGLVFSNNIPTYSDGVSWVALGGAQQLNQLGDVNVGSPGAGEDGYVLTWDNTAGEYVLESVAGTTPIYDITVTFNDVLDNDQVLLRYAASRSITIPASPASPAQHSGVAQTAPTSNTTLDIVKYPSPGFSPSTVGTITFNTGSAPIVASFTIGSDISLVPGDFLEIIGPSTADSTLADLGITFAGVQG